MSSVHGRLIYTSVLDVLYLEFSFEMISDGDSRFM